MFLTSVPEISTVGTAYTSTDNQRTVNDATWRAIRRYRYLQRRHLLVLETPQWNLLAPRRSLRLAIATAPVHPADVRLPFEPTSRMAKAVP